MKYLLLLIIGSSFFSCKKEGGGATIDPVPGDVYYYPPLTSDAWDTKTATSINWDEEPLFFVQK